MNKIDSMSEGWQCNRCFTIVGFGEFIVDDCYICMGYKDNELKEISVKNTILLAQSLRRIEEKLDKLENLDGL